jgi:hypothetical protein
LGPRRETDLAQELPTLRRRLATPARPPTTAPVPAPAVVPSGALVPFSRAKSFVPSFSGNNTEISVFRNFVPRRISTARSTPSRSR